MTCLITGGAGFIGCAISEGLVGHFDRVVAMDSLHPQIHKTQDRPAALHPEVELIRGDVSSSADWDRALASISPKVIVHLAAETGTSQSLTEASRHSLVNVVGTTQLTDALVRHDVQVEKIVLASSRAVYGEGRWFDETGNEVYPGMRTHKMLAAEVWDFPGLSLSAQDSTQVRPDPANVYAATKLCQENLLSAWCGSRGVDLVRLRLQNVYGPGQSLINPYTGIVSLFARLAKAKEVIPVYEDGQIIRDFVFIDDVADAVVAATTRYHATNPHPFDIGLGQATTIMQVAQEIAKHYGAPAPQVNAMFRDGDVRGAWANIENAAQEIGFNPKVGLSQGIERLCNWIDAQPAEA